MATKKGSTIPKTNGRPPKFKTEKEFSLKVEEYFQKAATEKKIFSKVGLRVHLDINRDTYAEYKLKFPDSLKKAEDRIEEAWVDRLNKPNCTGPIFYLKNAFREDYYDLAMPNADGMEVGFVILPKKKDSKEAESEFKNQNK